jgi:phosphatidylglycerol:prolipoprotein diacylglycerol transferase
VSGIPYHPFPTIDLGPVPIRVFGLMVAIGMLTGIMLAARRNARLGIPRADTERVAYWLIGAGLVGARLLWVFTHLKEIHNPVDVIAVWDGGLQFSGGLIAAVLLAPFLTRKWSVSSRWVLLDGTVLGLAVGQAIGRIGCYAVGEHLGGPTDFPLGIRYLGGRVIEGPLTVGTTYHDTALYEIIWLLPIIGALFWLDRRPTKAGTLTAAFCLAYGVLRFATDFLRINDKTVLGLTGAQYMCIALVAFGAWVLLRARRRPAPVEDEPDGAEPDGAPAVA